MTSMEIVNQVVKTDNKAFFLDFRLTDEYVHSLSWKFSKKALDLFHNTITFRSPEGNEGPKHYGLKQKVHDYIYDNFYLYYCKFFVTTELAQKNNPFFSYIDGKQPMFYTLDICVIREKDRQVFDIEIDGREHGRLKDEIRDNWLKDRYGIETMRIDENDKEINYKKLHKFIGA